MPTSFIDSTEKTSHWVPVAYETIKMWMLRKILLPIFCLQLKTVLGEEVCNADDSTNCMKMFVTPQNTEVLPGELAVFHCDVHSATVPSQFYWQHLGSRKTYGSQNESKELGNSGWYRLTLTLNVSSIQEVGPYVCVAVNTHGRVESSKYFIQVNDKPRVILTLPLTVQFEKTTGVSYLVVTCVVDARPTLLSLKWKTGNTLQGLPVYLNTSTDATTVNTSISGDRATFTLTLSLINLDSTGLYWCEATNALGTTLSQSVLVLYMNNLPKIFVNTTNVIATAGEDIYLPCPPLSSGVPAITTWTRDKQTIQFESGRYSNITLLTQGIKINGMTSGLDGVYSCTRSNSLEVTESASVVLSTIAGYPKPTVYGEAWLSSSDTNGSTLVAKCAIAAKDSKVPSGQFQFYWVSGVSSIQFTDLEKTDNYSDGVLYERTATAKYTPAKSGLDAKNGGHKNGNIGVSNQEHVLCQFFFGMEMMSEERWPVIRDGAPLTLKIAGPAVVNLDESERTFRWTCTAEFTLHSPPRVDIFVRLRNAEISKFFVSRSLEPERVERHYTGFGPLSFKGERTLGLQIGSTPGVMFIVCNAHHRNSFQTVEKKVAIDYLPDFNVLQELVLAKRHSLTSLSCGVRNVSGLHYFHWRKVNSTLDLTSGRYGGAYIHNPELTIYESEPVHTGDYYCVAGNSVGESLSPLIKVVVYDEPESEIINAFYADTVTLRCREVASTVKWFKINDAKWSPTFPKHRTYGSFLTIYAVQKMDEDMYGCVPEPWTGSLPLTGHTDLRVAEASLHPPLLKFRGSFHHGSAASILCSIELPSLIQEDRLFLRWSTELDEQQMPFTVRTEKRKEGEFTIYTTEIVFTAVKEEKDGTLLICKAQLDVAISTVEHVLQIKDSDRWAVQATKLSLCGSEVAQMVSDASSYNVIFGVVVGVLALAIAATLVYCQHSRENRRREQRYRRLNVLCSLRDELAKQRVQRDQPNECRSSCEGADALRYRAQLCAVSSAEVPAVERQESESREHSWERQDTGRVQQVEQCVSTPGLEVTNEKERVDATHETECFDDQPTLKMLFKAIHVLLLESYKKEQVDQMLYGGFKERQLHSMCRKEELDNLKVLEHILKDEIKLEQENILQKYYEEFAPVKSDNKNDGIGILPISNFSGLSLNREVTSLTEDGKGQQEATVPDREMILQNMSTDINDKLHDMYDKLINSIYLQNLNPEQASILEAIEINSCKNKPIAQWDF